MPTSLVSHQQRQEFDTQGFVAFRDVVSREALTELKSHVERFIERAGTGQPAGRGVRLDSSTSVNEQESTLKHATPTRINPLPRCGWPDRFRAVSHRADLLNAEGIE